MTPALLPQLLSAAAMASSPEPPALAVRRAVLGPAAPAADALRAAAAGGEGEAARARATAGCAAAALLGSVAAHEAHLPGLVEVRLAG